MLNDFLDWVKQKKQFDTKILLTEWLNNQPVSEEEELVFLRLIPVYNDGESTGYLFVNKEMFDECARTNTLSPSIWNDLFGPQKAKIKQDLLEEINRAVMYDQDGYDSTLEHIAENIADGEMTYIFTKKGKDIRYLGECNCGYY